MVMSKSDAIEEILHFNSHADPQFLAEFSKEELKRYLVRVRSVTREPYDLDQSSFETMHDPNRDDFASRAAAISTRIHPS